MIGHILAADRLGIRDHNTAEGSNSWQNKVLATTVKVVHTISALVQDYGLNLLSCLNDPRATKVRIRMSQPAKIISRQTAKVKSLAEDDQEVTLNTAESEIISRIRKCLVRANHPNTPEAEAKAALRMSSRLMEQYNVRHADLVAAEVNSDGPSTLSGQSTVSLSNSKPGARLVIENWVSGISSAMQTFFDCKAYTARRTASIEWTFYGIATNTVAAAMAFEMVHNLVQDWSTRRKGNKNSYRLGVSSGLRHTAHEEKEDEARRVQEKAAKDLAATEAEEKRQCQTKIDRLSRDALYTNADDSGACTQPERSSRVKLEEEPEVAIKHELEESSFDQQSNLSEVLNDIYGDHDDTTDSDSETDSSDDDSDGNSGNAFGPSGTTFDEDDESVVDIAADFEAELQRHLPKQEPPPSPLRPSDIVHSLEAEDQNRKDKESGMLWRDIGALVLFRENAQKIAEDYLKSQNLNVGKSRKRTNNIRDWDAYRAGQRDSKKIDVKRRRIEG